jgi:glycosyltransferase involved in cell wall biosynthesis
MHILQLIPTLEGGGAERQLVNLATELRRIGIRVSVGVRRAGGVHEAALLRSGVPLFELGDHRGPSLVLMGRIMSLLRAERPDIVQTWLPQMDLIGGAACRLMGIPWILCERSSGRVRRSFTSSSAESIRRWLAPSAAAVVANSQAGADYWRCALKRGKQVNCIHNGIDVKSVRAAVQDCAESGTPEGGNFLVVGRLICEKRIDVVIEASAILSTRRRLSVEVVGNGVELGVLERTVRDRGLENVISFSPYSEGWWAKLRNATAVISMSENEGQPNVVLEAMAGCCPVIVSDIAQHRAVLNDGSALFVPRGNAPELSKQMERCMIDRQAASRRVEVAFATVRALTVEAAADQYLGVYKRILQR